MRRSRRLVNRKSVGNKYTRGPNGTNTNRLWRKADTITYPFQNNVVVQWSAQSAVSDRTIHYVSTRLGALTGYPGNSADGIGGLFFQTLGTIIGENRTLMFNLLGNTAGLTLGPDVNYRKFGYRFNKLMVTWTLVPDVWRRTSNNPSGFAQNVNGVPIMTPDLTIEVAPNFDADTHYKSLAGSGGAYADLAACTTWVKLRPRQGQYTYKQKWICKGDFMDGVFQFNTVPTTVAAFQSKTFPYSIQHYANNVFSPTAIDVEGGAPFGSQFPSAQSKALGNRVDNVFRAPAFRAFLPGIGPDPTTAAQGAAVFMTCEIQANISGSISIVGNNDGMTGTTFPLEFEIRDGKYMHKPSWDDKLCTAPKPAIDASIS